MEGKRDIAPTGVDFVFDTTARSDVIAKAADAVATFGTIGLVVVRADPMADRSLNMLGSGMSVRGFIMGDSDPDVLFPELVAYYKSGQFPLVRLVRTCPLADINQAIDDQLNGLCVKPVVIPGEAL